MEWLLSGVSSTQCERINSVLNTVYWIVFLNLEDKCALYKFKANNKNLGYSAGDDTGIFCVLFEFPVFLSFFWLKEELQ